MKFRRMRLEVRKGGAKTDGVSDIVGRTRIREVTSELTILDQLALIGRQ